MISQVLNCCPELNIEVLKSCILIDMQVEEVTECVMVLLEPES